MDASATFIEETLYVPALIIFLYMESILLAASSVEPEVTFLILTKVFTLSPGLILSGEYPQKKSTLNFNPELFSKTGTHSSSVHPGKTVLSYMTKSPFFKYFPIVFEAKIKWDKSGCFLVWVRSHP